MGCALARATAKTSVLGAVNANQPRLPKWDSLWASGSSVAGTTNAAGAVSTASTAHTAGTVSKASAASVASAASTASAAAADSTKTAQAFVTRAIAQLRHDVGKLTLRQAAEVAEACAAVGRQDRVFMGVLQKGASLHLERWVGLVRAGKLSALSLTADAQLQHQLVGGSSTPASSSAAGAAAPGQPANEGASLAARPGRRVGPAPARRIGGSAGTESGLGPGQDDSGSTGLAAAASAQPAAAQGEQQAKEAAQAGAQSAGVSSSLAQVPRGLGASSADAVSRSLTGSADSVLRIVKVRGKGVWR